jgi:hypothetical protein
MGFSVSFRARADVMDAAAANRPASMTRSTVDSRSNVASHLRDAATYHNRVYLEFFRVDQTTGVRQT